MSNEDIDIDHLLHLSRIEVDDKTKQRLKDSLPSILSYVEAMQEAVPEDTGEPKAPAHRNVLREDADPHEPNKYTDKLLEEAPNTKGRYVKVKNIL